MSYPSCCPDPRTAARASSVPAESSAERLGGLAVVLGGDMLIDANGDSDVGVAEALGDDLDGHTGPQQDGGRGVAGIVEANGW